MYSLAYQATIFFLVGQEVFEIFVLVECADIILINYTILQGALRDQTA